MALIAVVIRVAMAGVFATAVWAKVRNARRRADFVQAVRQMARVPAKVAGILATGAALAEAAAAVLLAAPLRITGLIGLVLAVALLGLFTVLILAAVHGRRSVSCQCFGRGSLVRPAHLARNAILLGTACLGFVVSYAAAPPTPADVAIGVLAGVPIAVAVVRFDDIAAAVRPAAGPQSHRRS